MLAMLRFYLECPEGAQEQVETIYEKTGELLDTVATCTSVCACGNPRVIARDGDWSVEQLGHLYVVRQDVRMVCETTFKDVALLVYNNRLERSTG